MRAELERGFPPPVDLRDRICGGAMTSISLAEIAHALAAMGLTLSFPRKWNLPLTRRRLSTG